MPILRNTTVVSLAKGLKAFLDVEAGITRSGETTREELERLRDELARRNLDGENTLPPKGSVARPEDIVWVFGYASGRSGNTWLARMFRDLDGCSLWSSPQVGTLFGEFYYDRPVSREAHIMSRSGEAWLDGLRAFILENVKSRHPDFAGADAGHLVVSEHHGSLGAPLIMEALPESRMVLMMRDPRDVAASVLDAWRAGGWTDDPHTENRGTRKNAPDEAATTAYTESLVKKNARSMGKSREAFDAHAGPKTLIKYEDLRAEPLSAMRRALVELRMGFDDGNLARVVEKHAWENIPDEQKGGGKFHRKATPGAWKEDLDPEQIAKIEENFAPLINEFYPPDKVEDVCRKN